MSRANPSATYAGPSALTLAEAGLIQDAVLLVGGALVIGVAAYVVYYELTKNTGTSASWLDKLRQSPLIQQSNQLPSLDTPGTGTIEVAPGIYGQPISTTVGPGGTSGTGIDPGLTEA